MCKAMEDLRKESIEYGFEKGRAFEHIDSLINSIRNLKDTLGLTNQQARMALKVSNEDWEKISAMI